ncbi:insulinase family protein [Chlamydia caviae]|uniref:Protease 3 n=1 Tax=Chlamydia caviae (strain ATCC VR-813 / DSM 19441 / 03DC25 / GPIC) TaxID=227941 RepID=Q821X3_CHLCV|nr:insulinase family protein [Chlamydia caviae]AAP05553.1 metalloprotease, insulinase family [Chlamydia caviae GPIC]
MKWRALSVTLLLSLLVTSCKQHTRTIPDQCPLKILTPSIADQKTAKVVCANGLQLLIVSNPSISNSGAALAVKTGNSSDPKEFPGLAHLTEHCVFLGNEKYPNNEGFSHFLSNNNGIHNAYTSSYTTSYLFSIKNSAFPEAINQFVHLFIQPIFDQEDIDREKNAVHQEFVMHPNNDLRRVHRIQQLIAPQGHPIQRFGCGNAFTLAKVKSQDMHAWFQQHYHPENMIAVIHTVEPIEKAVKIFPKIFSKIPSKKNSLSKKTFSLPETDLSAGKLYINSAVEPTASIKIYWHLYNTSQAPFGCYAALAYVLNHEATGSLVSLLKKEKLITGFDSGFYKTSDSTGNFTIYYQLTEKGEREYSKVLLHTFKYLHQIQEEGIPAYCLKDISTINTLEYCYSSKTDLFRTLQEQIADLIDEDLSTFPYQSLVYPKYSPEEEQNILKILSDPYQAHYVLSTKNPENWQKAIKHHDTIFKMDYYEASLPDLESYKQAFAQERMALPQPNIYIPKNIEVTGISRTENNEFPFKPQLAYKDSGLTLYYCEDYFYTMPKLTINLRMRSPNISRKNIRSLIATDLCSLAINENLLKEYYLAAQAGLFFSTSLRGDGLNLEVSGYNATAPILLKSILSSLKPSIEKERFDIHKQRLIETYQRKISECPIRAGMDRLWSYTLNDVYSYQDKLSALQTMDFEEVENFSKILFEQLHVEAMVLGPPSKKQEQELVTIVKDFVSAYPTYEADAFYYQRQDKKISNIKIDYPLSGNAMLLVLQDTHSSSIEHIVATEMMFKWLHHIAFSHLRTEQQLGYVIGACYHEPLLCPSGLFYIRSNAYTPQELVAKTKTFIEEVALSPEKFGMSEQYFSDLKDAYIKNITDPTHSLESMGLALFSLAFEKASVQFSQPNQKITAAKTMSYTTFKTYCQEFLNQKLGSEIPVYIHGKDL